MFNFFFKRYVFDHFCVIFDRFCVFEGNKFDRIKANFYHKNALFGVKVS